VDRNIRFVLYKSKHRFFPFIDIYFKGKHIGIGKLSVLLLLYKKEVNLTADLFMNIYEHAIKSVDIKLCYQVTYF
jgi:hypothetical protein